METSELIVAAQAGNQEALLRLLEVCRPQLRRYASRECASDDLEEAVQDALWLLYRRVTGLRTLGAFSAWLFQIIRRECLRLRRKRDNVVALDGSELSIHASGSRSDETLRLDLTRAISNLPQSYREILILRDISGFSSEEAARHLGIPVAAAKSRLHRARAMVRSAMHGSKPREGQQSYQAGRRILCTSAAKASVFTS